MSDFSIKTLLKNIATYRASDLHLVSNSEPKVRVDGKLISLDIEPLSPEKVETLCHTLLTEKQKKVLKKTKELDFAIELNGIGRFRGNYYYTLGNELAAAFRVIPTKIPSLDDLNSPDIFKQIIKKEKGLVLVTGATGSGKSTTLAALINEINSHESKHILTIEDPVEFIHKNKKSLISHRNVKEDTKSFSSGLKHALRQDPDIILIGEMRDIETISTAITAAETGHLVFGTMHTNSATQTINRIIDSFDTKKQAQVRSMLSSTLHSIISQSLLPKKGGGRIAAFEIMINNSAITNLIREDKVHQIYSTMQLNQNTTGMQTQTQSLVKFLKANQIEKKDAMRYASKPQELESLIKNL